MAKDLSAERLLTSSPTNGPKVIPGNADKVGYMKRSITLSLAAVLSAVLLYSVTTLAQNGAHERHPKIHHAIVALDRQVDQG